MMDGLKVLTRRQEAELKMLRSSGLGMSPSEGQLGVREAEMDTVDRL